MSAPIKTFERDFDRDLDFTPLTSDLSDMSEDDLFAPADLSEVPVAPCSLSVPTLSNSPGCTPAGMRPVRRPSDGERRVQTDAWSVPAPANWGRSRRMRSVQGQSGQPGRRALRKVATPSKPGRRAQASPSSDWALPF